MNRAHLTLEYSSLKEQIFAACTLEASAMKPGNVHPQARFVDLCYQDFVDAARIVGTELSGIREGAIGQAILEAVQQTRITLGTNVNLGIILLMAPLAAVPAEVSLADGIRYSLAAIDLAQTRLIYQAIQIAGPGGIGEAANEDVGQAPSETIVEAMKLARTRDLIAEQYANGFSEVLDFGRTQFLNWYRKFNSWESATIGTHLSLMADFPDSLIARKCGRPMAVESSRLAKSLILSGWPESSKSLDEFKAFDKWLRADGNRRNPGTTADMVSAILFSLIRDQMWQPPDSIEIAL